MLRAKQLIKTRKACKLESSVSSTLRAVGGGRSCQAEADSPHGACPPGHAPPPGPPSLGREARVGGCGDRRRAGRSRGCPPGRARQCVRFLRLLTKYLGLGGFKREVCSLATRKAPNRGVAGAAEGDPARAPPRPSLLPGPQDRGGPGRSLACGRFSPPSASGIARFSGSSHLLARTRAAGSRARPRGQPDPVWLRLSHVRGRGLG